MGRRLRLRRRLECLELLAGRPVGRDGVWEVERDGRKSLGVAAVVGDWARD